MARTQSPLMKVTLSTKASKNSRSTMKVPTTKMSFQMVTILNCASVTSLRSPNPLILKKCTLTSRLRIPPNIAFTVKKFLKTSQVYAKLRKNLTKNLGTMLCPTKK